MTALPPELKENRSDETEVFDLVNTLRLLATAPPGVKYAIASEAISAFRCVGRSTNADTISLARADGAITAVGVVSAAVAIRGLARVVQSGPVYGAVSGRVANDPVWVGDDGSLVFVAPGGASYVQPIAVCMNATDIYVEPDVPAF